MSTTEDETGAHLEHYGKKGMKWGLKKLQETNDRIDATDKNVRDARAKHPELKSRYKKAKRQYKIDKQDVGRKEAKKILSKTADEYHKNLGTALNETSNEKAIRLTTQILLDKRRA